MQRIALSYQVRHVTPEELIIMASESIKDINGDWIEEKAFFYVIFNGSFQVNTLKFAQRTSQEMKQMAKISGRWEPHMVQPPGAQPKKRKELAKLERGDYFGEVSFIYDCRRTCSVKSTLYATLGCINATTMSELLRDYPEFKRYLKRESIYKYNDDLKLFLTKSLSRVDYLKDAS